MEQMYEDDFEDDSTERQVSEQFGGSGESFEHASERDKESRRVGKVANENIEKVEATSLTTLCRSAHGRI